MLDFVFPFRARKLNLVTILDDDNSPIERNEGKYFVWRNTIPNNIKVSLSS